MSTDHHSATTALLALPSVHAAPEQSSGPAPGQSFSTTTRGYHKGEVDEWARWALNEIERLTHQVTTFFSHEVTTPQGQKLLAELMQLAADEVTGRQAAAVAQIEQMITGAHQQSDGIIADARRQAEQITASATQQASSLVSNARADAKNTTDAAEAHAAAVHEAAGARLEHFSKLYEDTIARIRQVHDVTGQSLTADQQRGSLGDEVARALAPVTVSAQPR